MNGLKSNIGGKNGRQMQQQGTGSGIPTLRIQADTPVPRSNGNTPVPVKTDKVQLPALSTTPRIVQQGKPCGQNTPRITHPNQVNNFYRYGNNKNGKILIVFFKLSNSLNFLQHIKPDTCSKVSDHT